MSFRPLKILFLIDSLAQGGSERSLLELLPYFQKTNITPVIVCLFRREEGFLNEARAKGYDVRFLPDGRLQKFRQLRQMIKTEHPDLIHTTLFNSDILGRLGSIGLHQRVLSSIVNISYGPVRYQDANIKPYRLRLVQWIDSFTARNFTVHLHAVSSPVKQAAITDLRIRPEKITVVERGRDPKRFKVPGPEQRRGIRAQLGISQEAQVLVSIGRQEFQKGHRYLLEAVSSLNRSHSSVLVLIAGRSGNATASLNELQTQLGLNTAVRFLGYRDDVPDILAAADIFVFPSLYEGLPGAAVEAMATGLPIVASDIAPVREIVEPHGNALLVPSESSTQLAQAIHDLLMDHEKARKFGKRSREIFEERFTIEKSASGMIDLYQHVVSLSK